MSDREKWTEMKAGLPSLQDQVDALSAKLNSSVSDVAAVKQSIAALQSRVAKIENWLFKASNATGVKTGFLP